MGFENFHPDSRLWIYAANRQLTEDEVKDIETALKQFCTEWKGHELDLKAGFEIIDGQFIVLVVDETLNQAGGCSIDKSVHYLKGIERAYGLDLTSRDQLYFKTSGKITALHFSQIEETVKSGKLSSEDLFYDLSITTLRDFRQKWPVIVNNSWLMKRNYFAVDN